MPPPSPSLAASLLARCASACHSSSANTLSLFTRALPCTQSSCPLHAHQQQHSLRPFQQQQHTTARSLCTQAAQTQTPLHALPFTTLFSPRVPTPALLPLIVRWFTQGHAGSKRGSASQQPSSLQACLHAVSKAGTPVQLQQAFYQLAKHVQHDKRVKHFSKDRDSIVQAVHALPARFLGQATLASSSESAPVPLHQLNSMNLCLLAWSLAQLVQLDSRAKNSQLYSLVNAMARHAVRIRVMQHPAGKAWMNASQLLLSVSKMGTKCRDSPAVRQLFDAAAGQLPQLVRTKQPCAPQSVSNALLGFAYAEYPGDVMQPLVTELDRNLGWLMKGAKPQNLSNTLWALATLGSYFNASTVSKLVTALAERNRDAKPQELSNTLWALAKLGYSPGASTVSKLATALAERSDAEPQDISNTLWALATLGCSPGASTVNKLATALAERRRDAKPQELSNTLWALATLNCSPGASTVSKLATALAEGSSEATPQSLSNTLWALATLSFNPGASTVSKLATALAERSNDAKPQELSNTLWALSELRWYDSVLYRQLVEGVLLKISSSAPEALGQDFSNTMLSCALVGHFDSSVDALAEWGSQQDLHLSEQELANALFAWAILSATAGGDTTAMRALAQHLFAEASRRGVAAFQAKPKIEWRRDMGKLFSAHQEAQHACLPGGGVSEGELLQAACKHVEQNQQQIGEELSNISDAVYTALQGIYDVQAATVQGYHTLLLRHPSCPHGVVLAVTLHSRDYLSHPPDQLFGKAALRIKQVKRGCDVVVLCDESELEAGSEQVRSMLQQRIEQAVSQHQARSL